MKHILKILLFLFIFTVLYACKEQSYTVTFDPKGGLLELTEITLKKGDTFDIKDFEPTRDYYSFDYWYISDDQTPFVKDTPVTGNITLQAKWTPYQFMVIFKEANQGSDVVTTVVYPNHTTSYTPSPRDNFAFLGWYRDQDLSLAFTFGQSLTEHITLYPKWQQINPDYVLVTFDANEGEDVEPVLVNYDTVLEDVPTPVRLGYTFIGWFLDDELFDFTNKLTESIELIAMWEQIIYTVSFESNGGTTVITQTYTDGELFVLPTAPRKANHEFVTWLKDDAPMMSHTPITSSMTLHASWRKIYNETAQYNTYAVGFEGFNIHQIQNSSSIKFAKLITDTLYKLDYDWDLAIELGIAEFIGDFSHASNLPVTYRHSMALGNPIQVDDYGFVWDIQLKDGLMFQDETLIDAYTFEYSWKELISPVLQNTQAYYLYDSDYLPLVNAKAYYDQFKPDVDSFGFVMYMLNDIQYSRENAYYGQTNAGYDIYHVENKFINLTGPEGIKAYVEFWGSEYAAYGANGWVLETENDEYFRIGTDNLLYAPSSGWTLDGVPVPHTLPIGVSYKTGGAGYAGAFPAYMDELGNRLATDENGIPIEGEFTYVQSLTVLWSEVGFKVQDDQTFRITLNRALSMNHVKRILSNLALSVVHPGAYEDGKNELMTETQYGSSMSDIYSFGPYLLTAWNMDEYLQFERQYNMEFTNQDYLMNRIKTYLIDNESSAYQLYIDGLIDETTVSSSNYITHKNDVNMRLSDQSTTFYFRLNTDYGRDGLSHNDNPFLQYEEMRYALYFGFDRYSYATTYRTLANAQVSYLGSNYYSHIDQTQSYRMSEQGQLVLSNYEVDTWGYNTTRALEYFNLAYTKAVEDGLISDGDKIRITYTYPDVQTSFDIYTPIKTLYESVFGSSRFELILEPVSNITTRVTSYTYDMVMAGWMGLEHSAPSLLTAIYNSSTMVYPFEIKVPLELSIELPNLKQALLLWQSALSQIDDKTPYELEKFYDIEILLSDFDGDTYTSDISEFYSVLYLIMLSKYDYEGRYEDLNHLTATLEAALLELMLMIPIYNSQSATLYSDRIGFVSPTYHPSLLYSDYQYLYIKAN
jgi:ABC-type oligopeptide transport system substrate-binding subunit